MSQQPLVQTPAIIRQLGQTEYADSWLAMRRFTESRASTVQDEIWLTSHPPVYTLGQAGKTEHLLRPTSIPVVKTDRGGQITYHGPGQLIAYLLFDIVRAKAGIRTLVRSIEQAMLDELLARDITAMRKKGMPGVYVEDAKIGAIGLRIRKGRTYHGMSLNVDCDLAPFANINTCGYPNLSDTSLRELGCHIAYDKIETSLAKRLSKLLSGYN